MAKKSKNPVTAMASGCIAGAVEATFVWPMEFIKVGRMSTLTGSVAEESSLVIGFSSDCFKDSTSAAVEGKRSSASLHGDGIWVVLHRSNNWFYVVVPRTRPDLDRQCSQGRYSLRVE